MKIAVVEDDRLYIDRVKDYLKRYGDEKGSAFEAVSFLSADNFLFSYKPEFECILLDIDLPGMGGMEAAKKLRELDKNVIIVFSTSYAQFAIDGYDVDATDYLVKPYPYESFSLTMDRVCRKAASQLRGSVTVRNREGETHIPVSSILYVEQYNHRLIYHTDTGLVDVWGTMAGAERLLADFPGFVRCSASYLVNLRFVRAVSGATVTVGKDQIGISRGKKKEFLQALNTFWATGGGA